MAGISRNYFILSQKIIVQITVVLKAMWTLPFIIITVDIRRQKNAINPNAVTLKRLNSPYLFKTMLVYFVVQSEAKKFFFCPNKE